METKEIPTTIKLGGELGKQFGRVHHFVVGSVQEAISAMSRMIPGFERELMTSKDRGITYAVFNGKNNINKDELSNPVDHKSIRIVPVLQGRKAGVLQTIIGVVLIVIGAFTSFAGGGVLISVGISMVAGGVMQMLSPQPTGLSTSGSSVNNGASYNFNGPVNTTVQGNPVPLLYGKMIVGSAVISAGIYAADRV